MPCFCHGELVKDLSCQNNKFSYLAEWSLIANHVVSLLSEYKAPFTECRYIRRTFVKVTDLIFAFQQS